MNYELCKWLKDHGLPQTGDRNTPYITPKGYYGWADDDEEITDVGRNGQDTPGMYGDSEAIAKNTVRAKVPTSAELIEWLGSNLTK
jgi:hypothetical protein